MESFQGIGCFEQKIFEHRTTGEDEFKSEFRLTSNEPSKWFVYLFSVNGTVEYVGETKNGISRFNAYRYEGGKGHGKRISDLIYDALNEGKDVEVFAKEASREKTKRKESESYYIDLFDTKRTGWNQR